MQTALTTEASRRCRSHSAIEVPITAGAQYRSYGHSSKHEGISTG